MLTGVLILTGGLNWFGTWMIENVPALGRIEELFTPKELQTEILKEGCEMTDAAPASGHGDRTDDRRAPTARAAPASRPTSRPSPLSVSTAPPSSRRSPPRTRAACRASKPCRRHSSPPSSHSVLSDLDVGAIKTGMLANAEIVETVATASCGRRLRGPWSSIR